MTKLLSQLLGAHEPTFSLGLRQLERASGGSAEDVRLSSDVLQARQKALRQLGLDPSDTTARELYAALMQRVKEDSRIFESLLQSADGIDGNRMPHVAELIDRLVGGAQVFSMKPAVSKRLLRQHPPKKALKALGYRSIDSVLKHEPSAVLFAAASIVESASWFKAMHADYKRLMPSDFEQQAVRVIAPQGARWHQLAQLYTARHRHNIIAFRELGAVVMLPAHHVNVPAAPLAAALLVLQAVNDIRTTSTYLKLHLVRPDFGAVVAKVARDEPQTKAEVAGARLSWKLVHDYFSRHPDAYNPDLFEPHVHKEDLYWQSVEDALADLHPRFAFWQTVAYAGLLEKGEMVSLNIVDAVLSFCNMLPFEHRIIGYARSRLWHELMVRYMRQSAIEATVHEQLGNELAGGRTLM